jgi:hypothetical protein
VDPAEVSRASFQINGETFILEKAVQELIIDPVKGELNQPIAITPKTTFSLVPNILLFPTGSKVKKQTQIVVTALSNLAAGNVRVVSKDAKEWAVFEMKNGIKKGEQISIPISLSESELKNEGKTSYIFELQFETNQGNWIDSLEMQKITYDHIPTQRYYTKITLEAIHTNFATKGLLIGFIKGASDRVPEALVQMGYEVKFLNESDLKFENLKKDEHVVYKDDEIIILMADNYSVMVDYGSRYWCITEDEYTFNEYSENGFQLIIFFIQKSPTDNDSMMGLTVYQDGLISNSKSPISHIYAAHWRNDDEVTEKEQRDIISKYPVLGNADLLGSLVLKNSSKL